MIKIPHPTWKVVKVGQTKLGTYMAGGGPTAVHHLPACLCITMMYTKRQAGRAEQHGVLYRTHSFNAFYQSIKSTAQHLCDTIPTHIQGKPMNSTYVGTSREATVACGAALYFPAGPRPNLCPGPPVLRARISRARSRRQQMMRTRALVFLKRRGKKRFLVLKIIPILFLFFVLHKMS